MKEHPLPINKGILLMFAIIGFLMLIISTYLKITKSEINLDLLLVIALVLQFFPWIIVFIDIFRNQIQNKLMWFVGMFALSSLTVVLYLITRKNHVRLHSRLKNI